MNVEHNKIFIISI